MNLLLAIDGSTPSQIALTEICARTWPAGTILEVLHVVEPAHLWETSTTAEELAGRSTELLTQAVAQLRAAGFQAESTLLSGDPKRVILDHAAQTHADLIVVGSHGSEAVRLVLGNVASSVMRHAHCSVEVVRGPVHAGPRKILLAVDGSEGSEAAARSVAQGHWASGTQVRVLSVVELEVSSLALIEPPFMQSSQMEELRAEAMKHAENAVQTASEVVAPAYPEVTQSISVLLDGPREVILQEAADWGADLIVLGSHGRRGLDRFLLGGVAESVATHGPCSVALIRQPVA